MKNKKIIFLLILGVTFFISGVFIRKYLISHDTSLPKNSSILGEHNLLISKNPNFAEAEVKISKVLDGDTVEIPSGETIRYIGINSPEKGEPFFEEATKFNESLVLGKSVVLELDAERNDRYRRTLAYVFVSDKLVNLEMVKSGWAVLQTIPPNVKYQDKIVNAQKEAREKCLGMWSDLCDSQICIKIVSIYADAKGNDNQNKNGEWIEIKNTCSKSVLLNGWFLKDTSASNKYQFNNFGIDAEKNVILYSGCGQDSEDKLYWQCPEGKYAIWNNAGDSAFLYNEKGELVAHYQY